MKKVRKDYFKPLLPRMEKELGFWITRNQKLSALMERARKR
jgi:hypothetical protein